jgi:hypothetical protein
VLADVLATGVQLDKKWSGSGKSALEVGKPLHTRQELAGQHPDLSFHMQTRSSGTPVHHQPHDFHPHPFRNDPNSKNHIGLSQML